MSCERRTWITRVIRWRLAVDDQFAQLAAPAVIPVIRLGEAGLFPVIASRREGGCPGHSGRSVATGVQRRTQEHRSPVRQRRTRSLVDEVNQSRVSGCESAGVEVQRA